jgi:hypothetical protein
MYKHYTGRKFQDYAHLIAREAYCSKYDGLIQPFIPFVFSSLKHVQTEIKIPYFLDAV